jgi:hypothetical protein
MRFVVMKKLLISIAEKMATSPAVIAFDFQLSGEADPTECLERLRGALFLTGSGMQGARVIDADSGVEWIASSELLQRLNGPLFKWS